MCGRYITAQAAAFEKAVRLGKIGWQFEPSYNVAPTQSVPVVRPSDGGPEGLMMCWGLTLAGLSSFRSGAECAPRPGVAMASYHIQINTGAKGEALDHAQYIQREGRFTEERYGEVAARGQANFPEWARHRLRQILSQPCARIGVFRRDCQIQPPLGIAIRYTSKEHRPIS
jgi:hypothetical protein